MNIFLKGVDESPIKLYSIETRHSEVEIGYYERIIKRYNQVAFQQLQVKQLPAVKLYYNTRLTKCAYAFSFLFCRLCRFAAKQDF